MHSAFVYLSLSLSCLPWSTSTFAGTTGSASNLFDQMHPRVYKSNDTRCYFKKKKKKKSTWQTAEIWRRSVLNGQFRFTRFSLSHEYDKSHDWNLICLSLVFILEISRVTAMQVIWSITETSSKIINCLIPNMFDKYRLLSQAKIENLKCQYQFLDKLLSLDLWDS